ncbi:MAG: transcription elongation factor GreB [Burkholderiaceae bacterium]
MNKAFVREDDGADDDELPEQAPVAPGGKNYMTPAGHQRLKDELLHLLNVARPEIVQLVSWAASNGDRSENGDYLYGKKRLREIDRRIRFLTKRLDTAEVVDVAQREWTDQVFFGATVTYLRNGQDEHTVSIVGIDEADSLHGLISWVSPMARALTKAREGDVVTLRTPAGVDEIEILTVEYKPIELPPPAVA